LAPKSAFVQPTNDAWAFVAAVTLIATVSIPLVRPQSKADEKPDRVFRV
jgi:hypothetical protein